MKKTFYKKLEEIQTQHHLFLERKNKKLKQKPGRPFDRYKFPVLTSEHIPLTWKYDFNEKTNPFLLERFGINAVLNPGAIQRLLDFTLGVFGTIVDVLHYVVARLAEHLMPDVLGGSDGSACIV